MKKILIGVVVLAVVYLVGPQPKTPNYAPALPDLPNSGFALQTYVEAQEQGHKTKPDNEAEIVWHNPVVRTKTPVAVLYLHGFSASKREGFPTHMRFAEKYGCNLYLARLSDHGIDTTDAMYNLTPDRLWESAKEAYAIAKRLGDEVVIMSTSTGGTLALKLAATYPEIKGLINLSPNIAINDPSAFMLNNPWGLHIAKLVMGGNFRTVESDETYRKYWYHTYRIESIVALEELVESICTKRTFEQVTCPVFNAYYFKDEANQDPVVRVDAILDMHKKLGTPDSLKVAVPLASANTHVIGCDIKSGALPELFEAMDGFAKAQLGMQEDSTGNVGAE
jgi:esterase/lipase